jgi:hypothetical protein
MKRYMVTNTGDTEEHAEGMHVLFEDHAAELDQQMRYAAGALDEMIRQRDELAAALKNCRHVSGEKFAAQFDRITELEKKLSATHTHCAWEQESDPDYEHWETGCKNAFQFTDGGPKENNFKFCPYCGGKMIAITEPPESV